jgi:hypothetical protein
MSNCTRYSWYPVYILLPVAILVQPLISDVLEYEYNCDPYIEILFSTVGGDIPTRMKRSELKQQKRGTGCST